LIQLLGITFRLFYEAYRVVCLVTVDFVWDLAQLNQTELTSAVIPVCSQLELNAFFPDLYPPALQYHIFGLGLAVVEHGDGMIGNVTVDASGLCK
jgi:hypothetical protein